MQERKPKAFISTSLRMEDKEFCDLVTEIVRENNFEPFGTVGKYSQSPEPLMNTIIENIAEADCLVLVATPRYYQIDVHKHISSLGISDVLIAEGAISTVFNKPLLIFVQEGTEISHVFDKVTQRVTLRRDGKDLVEKKEMIRNYFQNAIKIIKRNKDTTPDTTIRTNKKTRIFRGEKSIFIGRQNEIALIAKTLLNTREPISIVGIGGVGKSVLAFKVIHNCEQLFDWIVPIYIEKDLTLLELIKKIADAFSLPLDLNSNRDINYLKSSIMNSLAPMGRVLLLLDGFDNISPDSTSSVEINEFLTEIPDNLNLVLTARNKNNIIGEHIFEITGLRINDAVELFIRISKNSFKNNPDEKILMKLKEVLNTIECHPLAIKLLAGVYRGGGISEIEHLSTEIIKTIGKKVAGRFRSIEACFDYSYKILTKKERQLLHDLTAFDSPFTEEIALHVTNHNKHTLYGLSDKCFLRTYELEQAQDKNKVKLVYDFHALIRSFLNLKQTDIDNSLKSKITEYYCKFIKKAYEEIGKKGHMDYVSIIELNFRKEKNDIDNSVKLTIDPRERSYMANKLGQILERLGYAQKALFYHQICLELDKNAQNHTRIGNDFLNIGTIFESCGNPEFAFINYLRAAASYGAANDKARELDVSIKLIPYIMELIGINNCLDYIKTIHESIKKLQNKLDPFQMNITMGPFYSHLAYYYERIGNNICKLACYQKQLSMNRSTGDEDISGIVSFKIAEIYAKLKDAEKSIKYYRLAFDSFQKTNNLENMYEVMRNLERIYQPLNSDKSNECRIIAEKIRSNPNYDASKNRSIGYLGRVRIK